MTKYRVKFSVQYVVEIDETNENVPGPPALQGNSELTALRRASWVLTRSDISQFDPELFRALHEAKRALGVKYLMVPKSGENVSMIMEKSEEATGPEEQSSPLVEEEGR